MKKIVALLVVLFTLALLPLNVFALTDSAHITSSTTYFDRASDSSINAGASGTLSIEGWFELTSALNTNYGCLVIADKWTNGNNANSPFTFAVQNQSGTQYLLLATANSGGNSQTQVAFAPSLNTWYYVAVSTTGGSTKYYEGVSGTPPTQLGTTQTGQSQPGTAVTATFHIGSNGALTGEFGCNSFNPAGYVSVVRFWSSDQSANFGTNYCSVLGNAGEVGEWTLDNTVNDNSGNGYTLTNTGTTGFSANVPACFNAAPSSVGILLTEAFWW